MKFKNGDIVIYDINEVEVLDTYGVEANDIDGMLNCNVYEAQTDIFRSGKWGNIAQVIDVVGDTALLALGIPRSPVQYQIGKCKINKMDFAPTGKYPGYFKIPELGPYFESCTCNVVNGKLMSLTCGIGTFEAPDQYIYGCRLASRMAEVILPHVDIDAEPNDIEIELEENLFI